jgi:hypothetical protein
LYETEQKSWGAGAVARRHRAPFQPKGTGNVDDRQRKALWQEANERNSRLQELIDSIATLVARSRDVLRRERPEDSAPAGDGKSVGGEQSRHQNP